MKSSASAKSATRKQINGIIEFLQLQISNYTMELKKYESLSKFPFSKIAIQSAKNNLEKTINSLQDYEKLKIEYSKRGLI